MDASVKETDAAAAEREARKANQAIAGALSWGEILWMSKKKPIEGALAALHGGDSVDGALVPLFLIPSLPQFSTDYLALAEMADVKQPMTALYLPSAKRIPENGASVHQLAGYYADGIEKFQPEGPLALGGWCAGAVVARAVAELLQQRGREIRLLVAIDGAPPSVALPPLSLSGKMRLAWYRAANFFLALIALGRDLVRHMSHRPLRNYSPGRAVKAAWQNSAFRLVWETMTGGTRSVPAWIADIVAGLPPDHRAFATMFYDAICAYVPEKEYAGDILFFEATQEPARSSERMAETWMAIAKNVDVVRVKGSHQSIVKPPDGVAMAAALCKQLREVSAGTGHS
jgi:thioesterase domain-containing protein